MDIEGFVRGLHTAVVAPEPGATLSHHAAPPGRARKTPEQMDMADWIRSMDDATRQKTEALVRSAADGALFGLLCVLDGVRVIDDGRFELWHVDGAGNRRLITAPEAEFLHDVYRGLFAPNDRVPG